jgi:hypothetical protein
MNYLLKSGLNALFFAPAGSSGDGLGKIVSFLPSFRS